MHAYQNKGFFIGLFAFGVIVLCGIFNVIPDSLLALEGTSFETNKGIQI